MSLKTKRYYTRATYAGDIEVFTYKYGAFPEDPVTRQDTFVSRRVDDEAMCQDRVSADVTFGEMTLVFVHPGGLTGAVLALMV